MTDEIHQGPKGWATADDAAVDRARNDGGTRAALARAIWQRDYQPGTEASIGGYVYEIADRAAVVVEEACADERRKVAEEMRTDAAAHRRLVARMPSEHDEARLARATCLDDAAARISRDGGK
jgi:hypothetical protein